MREGEPDRAGVVAPPPVIYLAGLGLGLLLQWWWPQRLLAWPVAVGLGAAIVLAGAAGSVWALLAMRRARTSVNPYKPTAALVSDGPYRFLRNPIYLADAVIYLGLAAALNTWWPVALLPVVLGVMQSGVIAREERYLERRFGEEYLQYKRRVRRWL